MSVPMHTVGADDDSFGPFPIADHVEFLIQKLGLQTTREDIEIHYVYLNDKKDYCHILFNWGVKNVFLVLVTRPNEKVVFGYRLLDLNIEYGLGDENAV